MTATLNQAIAYILSDPYWVSKLITGIETVLVVIVLACVAVYARTRT